MSNASRTDKLFLDAIQDHLYRREHSPIGIRELTVGDVRRAISDSSLIAHDDLWLELIRQAQMGSCDAMHLILDRLKKQMLTYQGRHQGNSCDEVLLVLASTLVEAVHAYNTEQRTRWVGGGLFRDATRTFWLERQRTPELHCIEQSELESIIGEEQGSADTPTAQLADVLSWAMRSDVLTPDDVQIIARIHFGDSDAITNMAQERGVSVDSLTRQCRRLIQRLTKAVHKYVADTGI